MSDKDLLEREHLLEDILDALEDGDIEEVEDLSDEAIDQFPEEAFGYYYMGEAMLLQAEYHEALDFYQKASKLAPDNPNYLARTALAYSKLQQADVAKKIYEKVLQNSTGHTEALLGLGVLELNAANYNEALGYLNKAIKKDTSLEEAYQLRSLVFQNMQQYKEALADVDFVLSNGHTASDLWQQKIALHEQLKDDSGCEKAFESWIAIDNEDASRRIAFGDYLLYKQKNKKAEEQYSNAIEVEIYGDLPVLEAFANRAWARLMQENYTAAEADFRKVISLDAKLVDAYLGLAEIKHKQSDIEGAMTFIELGLGIVVQDSWALWDKKGEIHTSNAQWDLAETAYQNNIAAQDEYVQAEGYFSMGNMYLSKGDIQKAYEAWKEADVRFHLKAAELIEEHCQEQIAAELKAKEGVLLSEMQDDFDQNAQSKVLSNLFGKLWKVDWKNTIGANDIFKQIPSDIEKQLKGLLENIVLVMTPNGMFVYNGKGDSVRMVYKIDSEKDSTVVVSGIPLDGKSKRIFNLDVSSGLVLSGFGDADADIPLCMSECNTSDLAKVTLDGFKKNINEGQLDFMGNAVKELFG